MSTALIISGVFGGEVVALQLNVDFSDADRLTSSTPLGDLRICNFAPLPLVNNLSVRQFLAIANHLLGGGSATISIGQASSMASLINNAFMDGNPSVFAQENLVNGACPWQQGDMLTYNQTQWGDPASSAGVALAAHYNSVYMGTGGVLEVGISGSGGFSTIFTAADAVLTYLPALGSIGTLTSDLVDPGSTSSGVFGGEVVALELNVAYSDAGFLAGTSHLGDLRICGFAALPVLNGLTVRQFLSGANTVLGGGSAAFNLSQATTIANFINNAFLDGNPSTFAQENLVAGACP